MQHLLTEQEYTILKNNGSHAYLLRDVIRVLKVIESGDHPSLITAYRFKQVHQRALRGPGFQGKD
jgi:hypothetical protein